MYTVINSNMYGYAWNIQNQNKIKKKHKAGLEFKILATS